MKKMIKKDTRKRKQAQKFTVYDCCWYGPYEHTLCCGGLCATPWVR